MEGVPRSNFSSLARLSGEPAMTNVRVRVEGELCGSELFRRPLAEFKGDLESLTATYDRYGE